MEMPSRVPLKLGPRIDFRPEEFRKFILKGGLKLTWEQAQECPCSRKSSELDTGLVVSAVSRTRESRVDCTQCKGRGYFYHSPQVIRGIITGAAENPERFRVYGEMATGMISITVLPEHLPSWGDRITLKDSVILFRETQTRAGLVEDLRFPIEARELDLADGPTMVSVLHAWKAGADGTTTAASGLDVGDDFSVTAEGAVDWTAGDAANTAPAVGDRYAMSYYAHPRYVVVDHPYAFRDTYTRRKAPNEVFAPLPVSCVARLEFLGGD